MNGINIGTLNVYRKDTSSGLETKLFSVSGNFGDLWYPRSITLESGAYSVVIEAVRGNGYRSDIAVDDILIQDGSCRDDHPVRLRGGDGSNGRVEVRHLGKWVTVCDETFDYRDARVLCRQIGYQYGKAVPLKPYGEGTTKWQMTNIDCEGEDNDVMQCRPIIVRGGCPHSQDSAVQCGDDQSSDVQLRLAGGSSDYGRVEVMYNGTWGTICDHYWSDENAKIVCKQLGYSEGKAYRNARFGIGSGPIWLSGVRCVGEEPVIDFCNNMQWGEQSCDHFSDASVACTSEAIQRFSTTIDCEFETEDNRLCGYTNVSGDWILWAGPSSSRNSGLLGPAHDHTKGTKTGGYMAAGAKGILKDVQYLRSPPVTITTSSCLQFYYHMFGQSMGSLNVYINRTSNHQATRVMSADGNQGDLWKLGQVNLTSQGTYIVVFEAVLGEENKSVIGLDDVSLTEGPCQNRAEYGSVRLAPDDGAYYGRLEVYYGGSWGSVCDDGWDDNAATVVCRMLGYQHGKSYVGAYFGQGSGIIMLDDVQCSGHEGSLSECSHGQWAHTNCDHREDAGVWCYDGSNAPPPRKGDVRLRNGNQTYEGLIEVYNAGYWGTVCSLGWDILDSTVMCSALGFSGAVSACNASSGDCHGQGSGDIWLSNVQCNGTETAIDQCPHDGWGGTPCTHDQDVGIVCKTKSCAPLLPPPFATVYPATCSLTSHPQQTTCNTTCQQGYILQGSETHRCQKDGIWSDMTGLECVDGIPPTLTCPQSIVVTAARGHTSATASWADPQASDNLPGAVQISQSLRSPATFGEGVTHVYVNATDKAGNIATCSFTVEVQVKRCPNLTLPRHAHVKDECRSHWGAVCTIGCATGYTLAGNEYVICEAHNATTDTNWGPITGACNIVQCSELPVRPHTTKSTCRQPYNYGDVCQQKCADGYELESGNATRTCTEQGVWSGEPVNCTVKRCPGLSPPSNGTVIPGPCKSADGVVPGSVCTISCLEGYRVEGNSERTCLTGGHWSGVAARCSVNAAPLLDCPDDITVKTTGGNLSATISWDEPTVLDGKNGTVDFTYSHSNPGTFTEGTHTIVATGHRDGDSGTCTFHIQVIVPRCPLADETKESGIVYIDCQNHEGATCAAICRSGYLQVGYSNRTCDVIDGVAAWREGNFSCRDIEPPSLSDCIPFTRIVLEKGQDKTNVTISPPVFNDNSGVVTVTKNATLPTSLQPGNHTVVYTGIDGAGLSTACTVVISVVDLEPPHVPDCMPYREIYSKTSPSGMDIQAPRFTDNVGIIEETAQGNPNSPVSWGSYDITYSAADVSGNVATCKSEIAVIGKTCNDLPDPFNGKSVSRVDGKSNLWTIKCTSSFLTLPQFSDYFYNCTQGRWHPTSTAIPCLAKHPYNRVRLSGSFILANLKGRCTDAVYRQQMATAFKGMLLDRGFKGVCSVYSCKTDVTITCEPEPIALFNTDVESSISIPHDLQTMVDSSTLELRRELINEITFMVVVAVEQHEITVVTDRSYIQSPQGNCRDGQQLVSGGCVSCPQGTFFNTETRQCVLCPKGTYQPISENLFCRPCPNNTTTETMGAAHVSECVGYCQCDSYSYNGLEPCITACPCGAPETRIRTTDGCGTPCTDVLCAVHTRPFSNTTPPYVDFMPAGIAGGVGGAAVLLVLIIIIFYKLKKRRNSVPSSAFEQPEDQEESYERLRSNIESSADSGFSGDSAESVELWERQSTYDEIPADGTDSISADDLPDPPEVSRHKAIRQKSGAYTHHLPHLTRRLTEERSQGASDQYTNPIAKQPPPIAKKPLWAYKSASTRVTSIGAEPPPDYDTDDDNGDLKLGDYLSMDGQSAKPDGKLGDYLTIGGSGAIPDTKDNEQSEALDDYVKPSAPETKSSIVGEETREASESSSSAVFVPTPRLVTRERTNTYVKHPIQPQAGAPPRENDSH
ncbi:uncharacterized protein LOC106176257 [Lingula anatina]|uniref:Uncharacterized protein LOC106176257 n=1 Tax=Lingula anatina TaxID=7574 RepID=A0A1S3JUM4_LINAN|nr:uncharacterized protein LOC106176257 [Lingula anatina]|eukprot:XP_013414022.1 uncharacterized protein LOC106176257 [Lingula anatina]